MRSIRCRETSITDYQVTRRRKAHNWRSEGEDLIAEELEV
jgi:hypothetical protein